MGGIARPTDLRLRMAQSFDTLKDSRTPDSADQDIFKPPVDTQTGPSKPWPIPHLPPYAPGK